MSKEFSQEWKDECLKYYGRVLTGKFAHWCWDWDQLPIDETCREFEVCCCYKDAAKTSEELLEKKLNIALNDEVSDTTDDAQ